MMQVVTRRASIELAGDTPAGWSRREQPGADLAFEGPISIDGTDTTVRVVVEPGGESIETASLRLMKELQLAHPDALLVNCELWPHPQWGDGRYIQSAHLDGMLTLAHDVYLFVDRGRTIRIEVDCALSQLLLIEETVATIVARLRRTSGARR